MQLQALEYAAELHDDAYGGIVLARAARVAARFLSTGSLRVVVFVAIMSVTVVGFTITKVAVVI
jgi:hypothetical protein